jgi:NAD(P)-dependent dehydrogenase (short-subunit alcohol dehydrogenase family)
MTFDAIIIGTGIGGGTVGRALAEAGLKVLFIEKGPAGFRAEEQHISVTMDDPAARLLRGFWPDPVTVTLNGRDQTFYAPLGAAVGGSSAFYAATLERPARHDLEATPDRPHPTGGWPVSFDAFLPWLERAEAMFHVTGAPDPLEPGPPLPPGPDAGPGDRAIMDRLTVRGLHPYTLHTAVRRLPGCAECLGRKCPRPCKMDGRSAGVEPALATGRATLWDRACITRILTNGPRATGVEVRRAGVTQTVEAPHIILAAGALSSPRLIAASGLADPDGPVGRYLMFHLNEIFAYFPGRGTDDGTSKSVGFRDLYHHQGHRLGMVQAMGLRVGVDEILDQLRRRAADWSLGRSRLIREGLRIPAVLGARLLGPAKLFVGPAPRTAGPPRPVPPGDPAGDGPGDVRRPRADTELGPPLRNVADGDGPGHQRDRCLRAAAWHGRPVGCRCVGVPDRDGREPQPDHRRPRAARRGCHRGGAGMTLILVTGAGRGMGRALARVLAERGHPVAGLGRDATALAETAQGLATSQFLPVLADLTDPDATTAAIRALPVPVTHLINNAAAYPRRDILDETPATFAATMAVNLGGPLAATLAVLPGMVAAGRGRILNVATFAGDAPAPMAAAYSVSKGAARILTRALIADLGDRFPGIVINDWMPGILATDMGRPDGLPPEQAAEWGATLALMDDPSLTGTLWNMDREILPPQSWKRRLLGRLTGQQTLARRL